VGGGAKIIKVPYTLPVTSISFGMMGKKVEDASNQNTFIPHTFETTHFTLSWFDWVEGICSEEVKYKIGDDDWNNVNVDKSQVVIPYSKTYEGGTHLNVRIYSNITNDHEEPAIQSLTANLIGYHTIELS
tara:strand:+ start:1305 stop:1694 length:390 start_codon:yes stop_codon:yes gene_type:complete